MVWLALVFLFFGSIAYFIFRIIRALIRAEEKRVKDSEDSRTEYVPAIRIIDFGHPQQNPTTTSSEGT